MLFRNFKVGDAFVGYQGDTPAAVVFQVTHLLRDDYNEADENSIAQWKIKVIFKYIAIAS